MSGAYFVESAPLDGADALAVLLSAQIGAGGERVNHYACRANALLGAVSLDPFRQGVMPRHLDGLGLWAVLLGEFHESARLDDLKKRYGAETSQVALLGRSYIEGRLAEDVYDLNGAFFLILWDPAQRTLTAVNDRFGLYPMYWAEKNRTFCLASRVLCSVLAGAADSEWDPAGVAQLLALDDYIGETTLVSGVECFPQATILTRRDGQMTWRRYWTYDDQPRRETANIEERAGLIGEGLLRAVKRQSGAGRTVAVTLSGGLDSRCLLGAACKSGVPVESMTWGAPACYDRLYAAKTAAHYGVAHHDYDYDVEGIAREYDESIRSTEGLINFHDCHMSVHAQLLRGKADVILNGYGGDCALGGSFLRARWMKPMSAHELAETLFAWRNSLVAEARLGDFMPDSCPLSADHTPRALYHAIIEGLGGESPADTAIRFFLQHRTRRMIAMGTVMLRLVTESAAPFFDYDLHEAITTTPATLIAEHRVHKEMMRQILPEALRLPYQRTLLPAGAPEWQAIGMKALLKACRIVEPRLGWPKLAYRQSPVHTTEWLRGPLRGWMDAVIGDAHPLADEVLRPETCQRLWREHLDGRAHTRILGSITTLRGFSKALERARAKRAARDSHPLRVDA